MHKTELETVAPDNPVAFAAANGEYETGTCTMRFWAVFAIVIVILFTALNAFA